MPPAGSTAGVAPGAAMPGEAPALDMAGSASEEASGLAGSAGMAPAADSSSVPAGFPPSFGTATAAGPVPDATGRVQLDGLSFVIPKNWLNEPPSSMMRQAQMLLPAAEGATLETRMVVFYLGPNAGSIEANIERWYGQLSDPQGRSIESLAKRESFEVDGMKVTIVDVIGTLEASSTPGMGSPITQPESRLLAAIVEAPSGPWFFKGVGPVSTMADAGQTFKGMLKTIQAVRP